MLWKLKSRSLAFGDRPLVMGIINVTPDSFSDGGRHERTDQAVEHGLKLVADGANILDIGGESTRPYSQPVDQAAELRRVVPVIEALCRQTDVPLSVDTSRAAVARAAIDAGADIINDVTGATGDAAMAQVARASGAGLCLMHMQGTPQTMQDNPAYENVVEEIRQYLVQRRDALCHAGIQRERICLDPGIGFGKTHDHNVELLRGIGRFLDLDCPILVGHSRKGFIRKLSGDETREQCAGTLAVSLYLARAGVHILRVHDVRETVHALRVQSALQNAPGSPAIQTD